MHVHRQSLGRVAARASLSTTYHAQLPPQLRHLVEIYGGVRHASTASSSSSRSQSTSSSSQSCSYPYPSNAHPSPHQIFHLPHGASQKDIKNRYYELVRVHHPDAPSARSLTPQIAQARFHAISAAYDILRGKLPPPGSHPFSSPYSPYARSMDPFAEEIRRRQATFRRRNAEWARANSSAGMDSGRRGWDPGRGDERWKDRVIVSVGIVTLAVGLYPSIFMMRRGDKEMHTLAAQNLREARSDAKEYGDTRRREVRRRVSEFRYLDEVVEHGDEHSSGGGSGQGQEGKGQPAVSISVNGGRR